MKKLLLIDVCDTLYPENTTVGFINYISKKNDNFGRLKIIKIINSLLYKLIGVDIIRYKLIQSIKGYSKLELINFSKKYIDSMTPNIDILSLMGEYKCKGYELYFLSASLDVVVEVISDKYQAVSFSSSKLKFNNDISEGVLNKDLLGNKNKILNELSKEYNKITFITDNKSDSNCINLCDEFIAVIPKGKANDLAYWRKFNVTTINL
ncbi:hypothetical protein [Photobacterium phosphoreum]|uniref:hypothetical protein n=1 Tax=Photobacterium phosphoreum TaxID=659 RepID=UPI001E339C50|nr:hypothetical protein [Photobacterium phosphoreum]MCD9475606.1 hypothetical protein [Photobacterium phosphoreum]MCF2177612.1 hypothetical protein [Photobacterium phosphoreum]